MSAVLPPLVCSEASALASSSACTIVVEPLIAARIRAVKPLKFCRLMLAPRCSSIRTNASCPAAVATISSVMSLPSAQRASTPPPPSSHAVTACTSPSTAASPTPSGSTSSACMVRFRVRVRVGVRVGVGLGLGSRSVRHRVGRPSVRLSRLPLGVLPQQLR
eukprot:scaffold18680_cov73-Phaeocystis_antarctica.AAC.5